MVSRDWTYGGHSGQVQETKKARHIREGKGIQGTGKGQKNTAPFYAMGLGPRCSEREDSCYSGGINNPIYYFLLRTGSHTLYDTKSPFSPQEATTIK